MTYDLVFCTVCIGESRLGDLLHLLNDMKNLNETIYVLTDINLNFFEKYEFYNVKFIQSKNSDWDCFAKFELIQHILNNTNSTYIYYLDCDSRLINCYNIKYNHNLFVNLLNNISFDIMTSWTLDSISQQLQEPDIHENKNIRNFKFGHPNLITYLKSKLINYNETIKLSGILEGILIFNNKDNQLYPYISEMLNIRNIIRTEDDKIQRTHKACASGFAFPLVSAMFNRHLEKNNIVYHFFKPNFTKEVFPFNWKIDVNANIFQ